VADMQTEAARIAVNNKSKYACLRPREIYNGMVS